MFYKKEDDNNDLAIEREKVVVEKVAVFLQGDPADIPGKISFLLDKGIPFEILVEGAVLSGMVQVLLKSSLPKSAQNWELN